MWIDRGGTFTDCLGIDRLSGRIETAKILSSDLSPVQGIRQILRLQSNEPVPPCDLRIGTTLATNALLETKGSNVALVTTEGFGDLLAIGDQTRPDLFELRVRRPPPIHQAVLEVPRDLSRCNQEHLAQQLDELRRRGLLSLAIVLLDSYRDGTAEQQIARLAAKVGYEQISLSHQVAPEMGLLARGETTVVDAYLNPLLRRYIAALQTELPGSRLRFMQSNGGLIGAEHFRGRDSVLSGPAGGVVAVASLARAAGLPAAIGFDMGGTSTDVCRFAGRIDRVFELRVAGVRVRAPAVDVHTVAAGGGSICRFDGQRFTVGSDSAGAVPGPLCYGHPQASDLALTDIALTLGRLVEACFPFALDRSRVVDALGRLVERLGSLGLRRSPQEVAEGFFRVAVENMAQAIHTVSIGRGHDVRDHALVVFGGAGGQYACAVARRLGIRRLLAHPYAGVFSAYGMGLAPITCHREQDAGSILLLDALPPALETQLDALGSDARRALIDDDCLPESIEVVATLDLRYRGTEMVLPLERSNATSLRERFEQEHRKRFGFARPEHPIEIVMARAYARGRTSSRGTAEDRASVAPGGMATRERLAGRTRLFVAGRWVDAPIYERTRLKANTTIVGPAIVVESTSTFVVDPGFELKVESDGWMTIFDREPERSELASTERDPVMLEVFSNQFMAIATQMGVALQRTASSTNIRERLDFSCALFDARGQLIANAPHIPVHLGAMQESIAALLREHPLIASGEVFASNDPNAGGSHLPDITVMTPVHLDGELAYFVASRGHHADIGGIAPGSMPAFSSSLAEEGIVLRAVKIVESGRFQTDVLRRLLTAGQYPARRPDENLADLQAQVAANHKGKELLLELVERYGRPTVDAYMAHVLDFGGEAVARALTDIEDGRYEFADALDDGTPVVARLEVQGGTLEIDFEGTGAESPGNLNAPRAVTLAAVIYFLRTLVGPGISLNSGCLRPVSVHIPEPSLLSPLPHRAVAGGNVETSQRVVDVLHGALGRVAASQGTMNNLSFGDATFGYYETLGGGIGAADGYDGASGVHSHMTNSRITDPEVLEHRFPVRIREFSLRRGSGGRGKFRGGDGLIRELELLAPMRVSILSERRERAPYGLAGGEPGAKGRNLIDGTPGGGKLEIDLPAHSVVRIETPGGGGWGRPQ